MTVPKTARFRSGPDDPSAGAGIPSSIASIYLRQNAETTGELWEKFGLVDTEWARIGTQAAAVADIPDPTVATAEDDANKINELLAALRTAGLLAT